MAGDQRDFVIFDFVCIDDRKHFRGGFEVYGRCRRFLGLGEPAKKCCQITLVVFAGLLGGVFNAQILIERSDEFCYVIQYILPHYTSHNTSKYNY